MGRGSRAVLGAPQPRCLHRRRAQPCRRQRAISSEWHGAGREERLIEEETRQMPLVQSDLLIVESCRCGCCQLTCGDTALRQGEGGQRAGRSSPRARQSRSLWARAHKSCPGSHTPVLGSTAAPKAPVHMAPAALAPLAPVADNLPAHGPAVGLTGVLLWGMWVWQGRLALQQWQMADVLMLGCSSPSVGSN